MGRVRNIGVYTWSTIQALSQRPNIATFGFALRYAGKSLRLFEDSRPDFLAQASPWMCFPAVTHLTAVLKPDARVFEYGSGGSTIYLARHAREVVSIEHEPSWFELVRTEIERRGLSNVRYQLVEPVTNPDFDRTRIADPRAYTSDDDKSSGKSYEAYARAIDPYPDGYFDMVVVDGRVRPSCVMHAMPKVRVGGILLLDQSERSYYLAEMPAMQDSSSWDVVRYMAPLPYSLHFTEATFFTKKRT